MIVLNQDTQNTVVVTLSEKTTISSPFYLFEFNFDDSNESIFFTGTDISTNKARYNEFVIELTNGAEDKLNSILNLPHNGFYSYVIYSQVSDTNLDVNNITEIVESGKVYVIGDASIVKEVYNEGQQTKTVYNG